MNIFARTFNSVEAFRAIAAACTKFQFTSLSMQTCAMYGTALWGHKHNISKQHGC